MVSFQRQKNVPFSLFCTTGDGLRGDESRGPCKRNPHKWKLEDSSWRKLRHGPLTDLAFVSGSLSVSAWTGGDGQTFPAFLLLKQILQPERRKTRLTYLLLWGSFTTPCWILMRTCCSRTAESHTDPVSSSPVTPEPPAAAAESPRHRPAAAPEAFQSSCEALPLPSANTQT